MGVWDWIKGILDRITPEAELSPQKKREIEMKKIEEDLKRNNKIRLRAMKEILKRPERFEKEIEKSAYRAKKGLYENEDVARVCGLIQGHIIAWEKEKCLFNADGVIAGLLVIKGHDKLVGAQMGTVMIRIINELEKRVARGMSEEGLTKLKTVLKNKQIQLSY